MVYINFGVEVRFKVENGYIVPYEDESGDSEFEVSQVSITSEGLVADISFDYEADGCIDSPDDVELTHDGEVWVCTLWVKPEQFVEFSIEIC